MPVRQRTARTRRPELSALQRGLLLDLPLDELLKAAEAEGIELYECWGPFGEREARLLWEAGGTEALAEWVLSRPGTRPSLWWLLEAPSLAKRAGVEVPFYWQGVRYHHDPAQQRPVLARLGALLPGE